MDSKLLDILACPICKGPLQWHRDAQCLVDRLRGRRMARLVEPVALQQRTEAGADAEDLVRVQPAAGALDQPVDVDLVGDHLIGDERQIVGGYRVGLRRRGGIRVGAREQAPLEDVGEVAAEVLLDRLALLAHQHDGIEQRALAVAAGRLERLDGQVLGHLLERLGHHRGQLLEHQLAAVLEQARTLAGIEPGSGGRAMRGRIGALLRGSAGIH